MKSKIQTLSTIVFFGSLWGITEATLGYVLHIIPGLSLYTSGAVLFSFASLILFKAYQKTNSRSSLVAIAVIAAAIKATNFFLPIVSVFKVINPMISIIMEALALFVVMTLISKNNIWNKISGLFIASIAWRGAFVLYMAISGVTYLSTGLQVVQFFGIYMAGSALFGLGLLYLDQWITMKVSIRKPMNLFHPAISTASLLVAIALTLLL